MLIDAYSITATRREDGSIIVDDFPSHIAVTDELLRVCDPRYLRLDGDRLYMNAANGEATYIRGASHPILFAHYWARIYCKMWDAPGLSGQ